MITVDKLLLKIVNNSSPAIEELLPKRDTKVLRSLASSILGNFFITENQSRLLLKILKENSKKLPDFTEEIEQALENSTWSKTFRQIEQVRKLYIGKNSNQEPCLILEFTFNSQIRKILQNLTKNIENLSQRNSGKIYEIELTEKNIVLLVEALSSFDFDIDETVTNHYDTIKSWSKSEIFDQFLITNITYPNFQRHITADLGLDTAIDDAIIKDRSVRYQYNLNHEEKTPKNLVEQLAYRKSTRVWVNKKVHSLSEVFNSLVKLKRIPTLVVFDNTSEEKILKNMEILDISLKNQQLDQNVGVYFRLPNSDLGKKYNKIISDNNYNQRLDASTEIVAVQSGKIPKFFLNSSWKPMSVIFMDSVMGMRHGKTAVYANCCDLIIEHADEPNLKEHLIKW